MEQLGPITTFAPIDTFSPIIASFEITADGCIDLFSISIFMFLKSLLT